MSTPSNPIVRAIAAVATGGLSEVPGQYKAVGAAVQGKDPISAFKSGGSPTDALMPKVPVGLESSPAVGPASLSNNLPASARRRRLFTTLLTNPYGLVADPSVVQKTTLLGSTALNPTLGR